MVRPTSVPRKQRTRQHVLADLSLNYVERIVLEEGHTVQRVEQDYGYDLFMFTYDDQGYVEPGLAFFQLKASESLDESAAGYVADLDIRDYNLWVAETHPIFLILYDAGRRRAYWLHVQDSFERDASRRPKKRSKTVVPGRQRINSRAVAVMRERKHQVSLRLQTEVES